jgi:hypothetical protein
MVIGLALLVGIAVAWALGARLSALADLRFRGDLLVFAALAIQIAIFTPLRDNVPATLDVPLHLGSYGLIVLFFFLNLRVPGFWLVGFGVMSNIVVITANGGRMPVTLEAWEASGADPALITATGSYNNNVLAGHGGHLSWLGDVFSLPSTVPFSTSISIGDLLVLLGMVAFVYRSCVPRALTRRTNLLAPLRSPAFRRVIAGRLVSGVGDWLTQAAVVTWIYSHTHSTFLVSAFLVGRILSVTLGGLASALLVGVFAPVSLVERLLPLPALLALSHNAGVRFFSPDEIGGGIGAYDFFGFPGLGLLLAWLVLVRLERLTASEHVLQGVAAPPLLPWRLDAEHAAEP